MSTCPQMDFPGKITYITTVQDCEDCAHKLIDAADTHAGPHKLVLGFDLEWWVTFKAGEPQRKTALLQLCHNIGQQPHCYLFHIYHTGVPPGLVSLLERPDVIKCGIRIVQDFHKLVRDYFPSSPSVDIFAPELIPAGVVDLGDLASRAGIVVQGSASLSALSERFLGQSLEKPKLLRTGNWEKKPLTSEQQLYAALDAYAGVLLFESIAKDLKEPTDVGAVTVKPVKKSPSKQTKPAIEAATLSTATAPQATSEEFHEEARSTAAAATDALTTASAQPLNPAEAKAIKSTAPTTDSIRKVETPGQKQEDKIITPSKAAAYELFKEGKTIEEVALARNIKESTAEGYIVECLCAEYTLIPESFAVRLGWSAENEKHIVAAVEKLEADAVNNGQDLGMGLRLKAIKERLGDDTSYALIRVVMHRRKAQAKAEEADELIVGLKGLTLQKN